MEIEDIVLPKSSSASRVSSGSAAPPSGLSFEIAHVVGHSGDLLEVRSTTKMVIRAAIASGAILRPALEDTVLILRSGDRAWITQVLARQNPSSQANLWVPGASEICVNVSNLKIQAVDIFIDAQKCQLSIGHITVLTRFMKIISYRICLWADLMQTKAQALITRAEQRITKIVGVDQLNAAEIRLDAEESARIEAGEVQVLAKCNVAIDGKRVLIG